MTVNVHVPSFCGRVGVVGTGNRTVSSAFGQEVLSLIAVDDLCYAILDNVVPDRDQIARSSAIWAFLYMVIVCNLCHLVVFPTS